MVEEKLIKLRELAKIYAKNYAKRQYLEEFKKSKLAMLMKEYQEKEFNTIAAQEREARSDERFQEILKGLKLATEKSELARWNLEIQKLGLSLYQTEQANLRSEKKGYG